jgi:hypothetical protein
MATFLFAPVRFRVSIFYTVQYIIITNRCADDDVELPPGQKSLDRYTKIWTHIGHKWWLLAQGGIYFLLKAGGGGVVSTVGRTKTAPRFTRKGIKHVFHHSTFQLSTMPTENSDVFFHSDQYSLVVYYLIAFNSHQNQSSDVPSFVSSQTVAFYPCCCCYKNVFLLLVYNRRRQQMMES